MRQRKQIPDSSSPIGSVGPGGLNSRKTHRPQARRSGPAAAGSRAIPVAITRPAEPFRNFFMTLHASYDYEDVVDPNNKGVQSGKATGRHDGVGGRRRFISLRSRVPPRRASERARCVLCRGPSSWDPFLLPASCPAFPPSPRSSRPFTGQRSP